MTSGERLLFYTTKLVWKAAILDLAFQNIFILHYFSQKKKKDKTE